MIAVISHNADVHANEVISRLRRRNADVVLLDTSAFPRRIALTVRQQPEGNWDSKITIDEQSRHLGEAKAVWWRRPLPFQLHEELQSQEDRAFAYGECHAAINGLWSTLDTHWVNDPERDAVASRKMFQLKEAAKLGLRVPHTCITNDPNAAQTFIAEQGEHGTIYKSFSATEEAWRETRLLKAEERQLVTNVRFAPVIFQEYIPAAVDVRVTIVGDNLFPAEIWSQETRYPYDFRMDLQAARIAPHALPKDVRSALRKLMATFNLVYGAVDLRLTPDGEYVFLEINPSGQWLFVEFRTAQKITDALCDHLIAHARQA
jgi:glutathione synthase/RimK-type ligase-like ATP-grasp enzyme